MRSEEMAGEAHAPPWPCCTIPPAQALSAAWSPAGAVPNPWHGSSIIVGVLETEEGAAGLDGKKLGREDLLIRCFNLEEGADRNCRLLASRE